MSRARTTLAALAAAALGVGTFAAVQTVVADPNDRPAGAAPMQAADPMVGQPAPDFTLQTADGQDVTLSDLRGNVVVLDFWATWCPPCRESMPNLEKLYTENQDKAFKLYAVNLQESKPVVDKYMKQQGFTMPTLLDTKGEAAQKYGVQAIPTTVVIGPDGKVLKMIVGADEAAINAAVESALAAG